MCGIQITKKEKPNGISHRGVQHFEGDAYGWKYHFSSLPLSSNKTNLVQPLKVKNGFIFFNGEIFNYNDFGKYSSDLDYLRDLFKDNFISKRFKSEYKNWDGFWAVCYVTEKSVKMFTDPLGKKQLYHNENGICSEIKPLLGNPIIMPDPKFGTSNTKFQRVQRCIPGDFYTYLYNSKMAFKSSNIYNINSYLKDPSNKGNLYELIDDSVKTRSLTKYNKVGLLFSGGLDSSIIAYHLIKNGIEFTPISIENGETDQCKKMAKYFGIDPIFISNDITEKEKVEVFRMYEHSYDLGSVIPQYLLFKKCKELNLNTVLTGDGSDELFGGYTRAIKKDTFHYDVFKELPYYHHVRIDRCSMANTVECRNPFLSTPIIKKCLTMKRSERIGKNILKEIYKDKIPFVDADKKPLRPIGSKEENKSNANKYFNYAFKQ
jgi:asparagine synthase (glutamine-hydrolysing)